MNGKISLCKKTQLSDVIEEFQRYIAELEYKFWASELKGNANISPNEETVSVDYFTDKDENSEEAKWIKVQNKYKNGKWTLPPLLNNINGGTQNQHNKREKRFHALPPIMVDGIKLCD